MATYDFVKECDKYKVGTYSNGSWSWGNWQNTNSGGSTQISAVKDGGNITSRKDILFRCPSAETGSINSLTVFPYFPNNFPENGYVHIEVYDTDPSAGSVTPIAWYTQI